MLLLLPSLPTRPCRVRIRFYQTDLRKVEEVGDSSRPIGLDEEIEEVGQAEDVEIPRAPEEGDSLEVVVETDHKTGKIP